MHSVRFARVPRTLLGHQNVGCLRVRFKSSVPQQPVKAARVPPALEYKGRIPKIEAVEPVKLPDFVKPVEAPVAPSPKKERTKEQKYNSTARRILVTICGLPIIIVISYHLYRRCKFFVPRTERKSFH